MFQPNQAVVMQMGKDGGNGAACAPVQAGQFGSPSAWLEVPKENLIHAVAGRVGFQQNLADVRLTFCPG
jgi:hypothetical protein